MKLSVFTQQERDAIASNILAGASSMQKMVPLMLELATALADGRESYVLPGGNENDDSQTLVSSMQALSVLVMTAGERGGLGPEDGF